MGEGTSASNAPHPVAIRKCFLREASSLQHQFHRAMVAPHDICEYVCFTHLGQFSNKMSNIGVTRVVFLSNVWSNKKTPTFASTNPARLP